MNIPKEEPKRIDHDIIEGGHFDIFKAATNINMAHKDFKILVNKLTPLQVIMALQSI